MIDTEKICMGCMNEKGDGEICRVCGYDYDSRNDSIALPVKFCIKDRYVIGKMLSRNGEGIIYMGWDNTYDIPVKIKEYFPMGAALRNPDTTVSIADGEKYAFNEGLLEFLEINKTVMDQTFSSLLNVNDVFEWVGTAYAVYENVPGITLQNFLERNGGTLKWEQARALFLPLIDTVKSMNDIGVVHKGISPETVMVGRDGKLRITDYSINKLRVVDGETENELFDGYAAVEQYGIYDMKQGSFTDVYGFCATLFKVLIGASVPKAVLRVDNQSLSIPAKFAEELPHHVLAALANGLKVKPEERTPDMETLKNELVYGEISSIEPKHEPEEVSSTTSEKKKKGMKSSVKYVLISALATALIFVVAGVILLFTVFKDDVFGNESSQTQNSSLESAPTVDAIGSVDSAAAESVKLYSVPDFTGKTYAEILESEESDIFKIVIKEKTFSDSFAKGQVCKQSVKKGEEVAKNTKIELTVSLGAKEFKMPNVTELDEKSAKLELLKAGFLYENIEVLEKYDETGTPGAVLEQSPKNGEKVNADIVVQIYVNTYTGEEPMDSGDDSEILSGITSSGNN